MPRINKTYLSLFLVAIIGFGLSLTAFFHVKRWELNQALEDQKKQVNEHVRALRQTFITFSNILSAIRGLYHVHQPLTQQSFTQFVRNDLLTQAGIQTLEWVGVIPTSQCHITSVRTPTEKNKIHLWEFSENGKKRRVGQRETYYPVLFAESINQDAMILGYDVGSNETLRTALENARDLGQLTTSGAIEMFTSTGTVRGFNVFLPVYQR